MDLRSTFGPAEKNQKSSATHKNHLLLIDRITTDLLYIYSNKTIRLLLLEAVVLIVVIVLQPVYFIDELRPDVSNRNMAG